MKEHLKLVVIPTLICLVCTAILAAVGALTQAPIAQAQAAREQEAVRRVLPDGITAVTPIAIGGVTNFVACDDQGRLTAAAVRGHSPSGYGGDITLMVGFRADGGICDFEVIASTETPGLGSKIASPGFKAGIRGRPAGTRWFVKQDNGDVDAITAATISSRAALEAIRDAVAQFAALQQSMETKSVTP